MIHNEVLHFLKMKEPKLLVLGTVSKEGKPWSAVLGYAIQDDLTLILSTSKESKKLKNIVENSNVSLVIGWEFTGMYVQAQGVATLISDMKEHEMSESFFYLMNPEAAKFKSPDTIFVKVKMHLLKVTDFDHHSVQSMDLP